MATDKTHKIPNAPNLRFPEFEGEWKNMRLSEMTRRITRKNSGLISNRPLTISAQYGLIDQRDFFKKAVASENIEGYYLLKRGEFAYNKSYSNEHPWGAVKRLDSYSEGVLSTLYICFESMGILSDWMVHYFDSSHWHKQVSEIAVEGARNHGLLNVSVEDFFNTYHYIPKTTIEQKKIATFLSLIDERITTQIGAIEAIESLITGITSKISRSNNVKQVYLKDLLTERTERNVDHHEVYSVSVSEGVVNQVEYLGRSFAAADTSHYCVARYGDIIYTKSPTGSFPYGIVKRSDISEPVAVSPLYGVYRPLNDNIGIYLHQYFCSAINAHNYLHKLIQKGAKNTINITNQRFLQNTIPIPDEVTLEKYVRVIDALVQKLKNEKFLLESYRQQKVYLLKNMFV